MAGSGVLLISIGAVVAGANDLTGDLLGFLFAMTANCFTAWYLQLSNLTSAKHSDITALTQAYYNGVIGLPFVWVLMLSFEEHVEMATNPYAGRLSYQLTILGLCVLSVLNAVMANLCTTINSPMATTVTGNIKVSCRQDVITMGVGLVAFGDVIITPVFLFGLVLSSLGAVVYSYSRLVAYVRGRSKQPSKAEV
jgi:hypothetical protein